MSRTYRRKGARYNLVWVLRETNWANRFFDILIEPGSPEGKKALARYFSDAGCGSYGHGTAPYWYRRYLNHQADRREEQRLNQWLRNSKPENDLVLLPWVKNSVLHQFHCDFSLAAGQSSDSIFPA